MGATTAADHRLCVRFPARLTQDDAVHVLAQWRQAVTQDASPGVDVDASDLQQFDSAAVAVLLELRRHLIAQGRSLRLQGDSQRLRDLIQIYGVAELLAT